jgi:hypothetical protein
MTECNAGGIVTDSPLTCDLPFAMTNAPAITRYQAQIGRNLPWTHRQTNTELSTAGKMADSFDCLHFSVHSRSLGYQRVLKLQPFSVA